MLQATLSFKDKLWSVIKTIVSKLLTAIVWIFVTLVQGALRHILLTAAIVFVWLGDPIASATMLVLAFYFELAAINDNTKIFKGK